MSNRMSRRTAMCTFGAVGLGTLVASSRAADAKDESTEPAAAGFAGTWAYRSFLNNPDIKADFNQLEFARAVLVIDKAPFGVLRGRLSFGDDFLALNGSVSYGNPFTARFQGRGATSNTKGWIYDYLGFLIPQWPNGVDQRPAFVGTVIRTVPHSDGKAKAGVVASFLAVKQNT
jgi:hypothetical protein